jgi:hypothetical protein
MKTTPAPAPYQEAIPRVVRDHNCMVPAYTHVRDLVRQLCTLTREAAHGGPNSSKYELEMRFGTARGDFVPGIPQTLMALVEQSFDLGTYWKSVSDWQVIQTYFHESAIPGDKRRLRTETCLSPDGVAIDTICKERVRSTDLQTVANDLAHPLDVRIAVSRETVVPAAQIPAIVVPSEVHIKERKSYWYVSKSTGTGRPTWLYTLTRRWSAPTMEEATLRQVRRDMPVCEIEVECVDHDMLLRETPDRIAFNVLHVVTQMLKALSPRCRNMDAYQLKPATDLWTANRAPAESHNRGRPA